MVVLLWLIAIYLSWQLIFIIFTLPTYLHFFRIINNVDQLELCKQNDLKVKVNNVTYGLKYSTYQKSMQLSFKHNQDSVNFLECYLNPLTIILVPTYVIPYIYLRYKMMSLL